MVYGGPIAGEILDGKDKESREINENRLLHEVHGILEDLQNGHGKCNDDDVIKHTRHFNDNDYDKDGFKWDDEKSYYEEVVKTDGKSHENRHIDDDGQKWGDDDRHQHLHGQKHENIDGKTITHSYTVHKIINQDDEKDEKHNNDSWRHDKDVDKDKTDWHDTQFKQGKDDHFIQHDKNWHGHCIKKDNDRHDRGDSHDLKYGKDSHDDDIKDGRDSHDRDLNLWTNKDDKDAKQCGRNDHGDRNRHEAKNRGHFKNDDHNERID